jgi:hypothetical protein
MVLVLALWLLAKCPGSDGLQEKATKRRRRHISAGEEEGT